MKMTNDNNWIFWPYWHGTITDIDGEDNANGVSGTLGKAFDFWNDPEEDKYTMEDGDPPKQS